MITNVALYLNYELFHYCCHVKDDRIVRHVPFVNSIRRHHIAHHNTALMMDKGMAARMISDRRTLPRKRMMTSAVSAAAMPALNSTLSSAALTNTD